MLAAMLIMIFIVLCLILKTVCAIIQHQRISKKQAKVRKLISDLAPIVFEMEIKTRDGSLDKFPAMKKQFISFVQFYDSFSVKDEKLLGLSVKRSIQSIMDGDKQSENELELIKDELLAISNKRILELFVQQLCFVHCLMLATNPYKYRLGFILFELKKNPVVRNLRGFDVSALKVSNTKNKKLEIIDLSAFAYNGFKSVY